MPSSLITAAANLSLFIQKHNSKHLTYWHIGYVYEGNRFSYAVPFKRSFTLQLTQISNPVSPQGFAYGYLWIDHLAV